MDIIPGKCALEVTKEALMTATQPGFTLYVNQTATFDFRLTLGAATRTVTVEAGDAGTALSALP